MNWAEIAVSSVAALFAAFLGAVLTLASQQLITARDRRRVRKAEQERFADMTIADGSSATSLKKLRLPEFESRLPSAELNGPYFYLTEISLQNFRCFTDTTIALRYPYEAGTGRHKNVNLLLGNNGSGKSSVLRAVAMTALGPILEGSATGFRPYRLVREGQAEARIAASFAFSSDTEGRQLLAELSLRRRGTVEQIKWTPGGKSWGGVFDESSPFFFVLGYGVNRRVADVARAEPSLEVGRSGRRYQRVSSLFDETVALVPFGAWLPSALKRRQGEVRDVLRRLLPENVEFTNRFEGEQPVFRRNGIEVPFRALSDGLQSYVGWLGDLLFHLDAAAPAYAFHEVGGIVMVDEIDLLLHPAWQRDVVPTVGGLFPKIQFIFTTHSPIVTGTLESQNLILAEESLEDSNSVLRRLDARVHGLSAEQLLLSSYFDLRSTRAPDAMPALEDLARRAVDGDETARRKYIDALARGLPTEEPLGD
ncbi:AAA family ATPase [Mycobacterium sp. pW049]|uniref:AAA family ATPase n=1 Tax=[Mycobacterium] bulgaricum TaxID=3238985 RepID=UPI00351B305E